MFQNYSRFPISLLSQGNPLSTDPIYGHILTIDTEEKPGEVDPGQGKDQVSFYIQSHFLPG